MINEKGLVHQMKKAYSGGGLKVVRYESEGVDYILFNSGFWCAAVPMAVAPAKALGLVAEYLRRMPLIGEGFLLQKKLEPEVLKDGNPLDFLKINFAKDCKLIPFTLGGRTIFQTRSLNFVTVDIEMLEAINSKRNMGRLTEAHTFMRWQDPDEDSYFFAVASPNIKAKDLARLRGQNFWLEEKEDAESVCCAADHTGQDDRPAGRAL